MSALCFMLCKDEPLYELDLSGRRDDASSRNAALALHAALDGVDRALSAGGGGSSGACFLKVVDRANELLVSAHVTAGGARLLLLHDGRAEDGVRAFFGEVAELWVKLCLNPFYHPLARITSRDFDDKVRALARRYLGFRA